MSIAARATGLATPSVASASPGEQPWLLGIHRRWWVAAVVVPACAAAEASFSGILFATPALVQALDTDKYRYDWALGPYVALLIVACVYAVRLQQLFGARLIFALGMAVFGVGALLAGASTELWHIVIARLLMSAKGLAVAVALTQLWMVFPRRKGLSMALYGSALYGGIALGVGLGAFVAFNPSWRAAYLACGTVALITAWAGWHSMVRDRPRPAPAIGWDLPGLVLMTLALVAASFLVLWGQYYGWLASPTVCAMALVMVTATALFTWREHVAPDPIVSFRFTPFRTLVITLGALGLYGAGLVGLLQTIPGYFLLRGYQGSDVGWIMLPCGLLYCASSLLSGMVSQRGRVVITLRIGLLATTICTALLLRLDLYTSRGWITMVLAAWALGAGMVLPTALRLTFSGQSLEWVQRLASIKTALRFLAIIFGSFVVGIVAQRLTDANQDLLRQDITPARAPAEATHRRLVAHFMQRGQTPTIAATQARVVVGEWIGANASVLGYRAGTLYLCGLFAAALGLSLFLRRTPEESILAADDRSLPLLGRSRWVPFVRSAQPLLSTATITAIALSAGCSMTPEYVAPVTPQPQAWRTASATDTSLADLAWWELFEDDVLRSLVAEALEGNRELAVVVARLGEARAILRSTRASQIPQSDAIAAIGRRRYSENSPLTPPGGPTWTFYDGAIDLTYEVDLWGRLQAAADAADADLLASAEAQRTVTIALVADVAQAYFDLRRLDEGLGIVRAAAEDRAEALRIVKAREVHGVASELEVAQAETEYESTLSLVPDYQRQVAQTENRLCVLLGREPGPVHRGLSLEAQPTPPTLPAGLPSDLLLRRPDLREAEDRLVAANYRIGEARAAFFPRLVLFAAAGTESTSLSDVFNSSSFAGAFGPAVSVPLFTGGRLEGELDAAEARTAAAAAQYQQAVLQALREVNDALVEYEATSAQRTTRRREVDAARRTLVVARERYMHGLSDYLDVLDAQRTLLDAELDLVDTRRAQLGAIVQLYKALGGGWMEAPMDAEQRPAIAEQDTDVTTS